MSLHKMEEVRYIVTYQKGVGYRLRDINNAFDEAERCDDVVRGLIEQYGPMSNVYVMYKRDGDVCKVGVSDTPERRLRELGFDLIMNSVEMPRKEAFEYEKFLHSVLSDYQHNGYYPSREYFSLPKEILESLSSATTVDTLNDFINEQYHKFLGEYVRDVLDNGTKKELQEAADLLRKVIADLEASLDEAA
jgi:hypothetical protein